MERSSGILMAISSLPSNYGIGTFGKSAYDFVDFLSKSGQKYWQMLPLGPISYGDSPYQSFSSFAGNSYFIDLDILIEEKLLKKEEVDTIDWGDDPSNVDYGKIYKNRFKVLQIAKDRDWEKSKESISHFCQRTPWLYNYALFMACKRFFKMVSWQEWPDDIKKREEHAIAYYSDKLNSDIELFVYIQYQFFKQWDKLKNYIHSKGIKIIGDIPIYVALDSVDVWTEPWQFQLDGNLAPVNIAGCPPDAFAKDGQRWGNPLYNYDFMKNDGFGWWIRRIGGISNLYDVIRVDHFRGFDEYWSSPASEETAKNGHWNKGPGLDLINVLNNWLDFRNLNFIAEDLGFLTESVHKLVQDSGWPSMKVLEFAFDSHDSSSKGFLPHNYERNTVCYTGTHDNETIMQWFTKASKEDVKLAKEYLNLSKEEGYNWGFIRGGMSSVSNLFMAPLQDYLGLGEEARMNFPSKPNGWWKWRAKEADIVGKDADKLAKKILTMTKTYDR